MGALYTRPVLKQTEEMIWLYIVFFIGVNTDEEI